MSNELQVNEGNKGIAINYAAKIDEFKAKNKEFDLDFVDLGTYLRINSKGQLEGKDNPDLKFDTIQAVVISGKSKYNLWGADGSPDENELLFSVESVEEAKAELEELCSDPLKAELYSWKEVSKRYIITFIAQDGNIYSIDMSQTSKFSFANYIKQLFNHHSLGMSDVVTEISTEEKKKDRNSWSVITFKFLRKVSDDNAQ